MAGLGLSLFEITLPCCLVLDTIPIINKSSQDIEAAAFDKIAGVGLLVKEFAVGSDLNIECITDRMTNEGLVAVADIVR